MNTDLPTWVIIPSAKFKWLTDPDLLTNVVRSTGCPVIKINHVGDCTVPLGSKVVVYGNNDAVKNFVSYGCWNTTYWGVEHCFDCGYRFGICGDWSSQDYAIIPVADLARRRGELFSSFGGRDGRIVLHPDGCARSFEFTPVQFDSWVHGDRKNDAICTVTAPVPEIKRHCFFVHRGTIIAGASWLGIQRTYCGNPYAVSHLTEIAAEISEAMRPAVPPVYRLDISESLDGDFTLHGFVSANTAYDFGADLVQVVRAMTAETQELEVSSTMRSMLEMHNLPNSRHVTSTGDLVLVTDEALSI
jgi:hypothetical protein